MFGFFNHARNCSRRSAIRENRHDYEARAVNELPAHDLIPSLADRRRVLDRRSPVCCCCEKKSCSTGRASMSLTTSSPAWISISPIPPCSIISPSKNGKAPRASIAGSPPIPGTKSRIICWPFPTPSRTAPPRNWIRRFAIFLTAAPSRNSSRTAPARIASFMNPDVRQFVAYAKAPGRRRSDPGDHQTIRPRPGDSAGGTISPGQVRHVVLLPPKPDQQNPQSAAGEQPKELYLDIADVYGSDLTPAFEARLEESARVFGVGLAPKIARITFAQLAANPNYQYDDEATQEQQNQAESTVSSNDAVEIFVRGSKIVSGPSTLSDRDFALLQQENNAYHASLAADVFHIWQYRLGLTLVAGILTFILAAYVARFQRRCVRNHARALAMAGLLLAMLLLTQLAGIGSKPLLVFGIAPTIIAAMILTIAYDQRFAFGVATVHAIIVTTALDQGLDSFLVLWVGVLTRLLSTR